MPDPAIPAGAVAATAGGPTAGQDLAAAPTPAGDHRSAGASDQLSGHLCNGAPADCAGADVQSAELENLTNKKQKKRRKAESGTAF